MTFTEKIIELRKAEPAISAEDKLKKCFCETELYKLLSNDKDYKIVLKSFVDRYSEFIRNMASYEISKGSKCITIYVYFVDNELIVYLNDDFASFKDEETKNFLYLTIAEALEK